MIDQIAAAQRGRVARWQLVAGGVSDGAIRRRVDNGKLVRVHHGVYAVSPDLDVLLAAETAALLACGPEAMLADHSAATLWGIRVGDARPIHVLIPAGRSGPELEGVIVHRSTILRPADRQIEQGLPVTSPARTLLEMARRLPIRDLERYMDEAYAKRILKPYDLTELLRRAGGHRGKPALLKLHQARGGSGRPRRRTETRGEELLFQAILDAGLPEPQVNQYVLGYRLDLYWPELKLCVEVDGPSFHAIKTGLARDHRRDHELLLKQGIETMRFLRDEVERRTNAVVVQIGQAIALAHARRAA